MKKRATDCESCANYIYDEESQSYYCDCNLDQDEMEHFLSYNTYNCPYFSFGDEYKIVRKQN